MNWQLFLFAVIGLLIMLIYEVNKDGVKNMNWQKVALRYGLCFLILAVATYLSDTQPVKDLLMLTAAGGVVLLSLRTIGK